MASDSDEHVCGHCGGDTECSPDEIIDVYGIYYCNLWCMDNDTAFRRAEARADAQFEDNYR